MCVDAASTSPADSRLRSASASSSVVAATASRIASCSPAYSIWSAPADAVTYASGSAMCQTASTDTLSVIPSDVSSSWPETTMLRGRTSTVCSVVRALR